MRSFFLTVSAVFIAVTMANGARAEDDFGAMIRVEAGLTDTRSTDWAMGGDLGRSPVLGLAGGWRFNRYFRLEMELNDRSDLEYSGRDGTFNVSGRARNRTLMANAFADIPVSDWLVPYVGVGFGRSWTNIKSADYASTTTTGIRDGDHIHTWAWQWMVGVGIPVTEALAIDIGYRHLDAGMAKLGDVGQVGGVSGSFANAQQGQLKANEWLIGVRYEF